MTAPNVSAELQTLVDKVTRATTVDESVAIFVADQATKLRALVAAATDLAALKAGVIAQADALDAGTTKIQDAVVANTDA